MAWVLDNLHSIIFLVDALTKIEKDGPNILGLKILWDTRRELFATAVNLAQIWLFQPFKEWPNRWKDTSFFFLFFSLSPSLSHFQMNKGMSQINEWIITKRSTTRIGLTNRNVTWSVWNSHNSTVDQLMTSYERKSTKQEGPCRFYLPHLIPCHILTSGCMCQLKLRWRTCYSIPSVPIPSWPQKARVLGKQRAQARVLLDPNGFNAVVPGAYVPSDNYNWKTNWKIAIWAKADKHSHVPCKRRSVFFHQAIYLECQWMIEIQN